MPMPTILDLWRWRVTDPDTGRRYTTTHRMTEADARALDPGAERIPGTLEVREVPADPTVISTSAWQGKLPDVR